MVLPWGCPGAGREGSGVRAGRGAGVAADVTEPAADPGPGDLRPGRDAPCWRVRFPGWEPSRSGSPGAAGGAGQVFHDREGFATPESIESFMIMGAGTGGTGGLYGWDWRGKGGLNPSRNLDHPGSSGGRAHHGALVPHGMHWYHREEGPASWVRFRLGSGSWLGSGPGWAQGPGWGQVSHADNLAAKVKSPAWIHPIHHKARIHRGNPGRGGTAGASGAAARYGTPAPAPATRQPPGVPQNGF